jgi:hypothetical protein
MKVPFYKRASFWNLIIQSFQIGLGSFQAITLSNEKHIEDYNIITAGIQALLGILGLWTRDQNRNDIIDIAEPQVDVTITSNTPVNVKTEINDKNTP